MTDIVSKVKARRELVDSLISHYSGVLPTNPQARVLALFGLKTLLYNAHSSGGEKLTRKVFAQVCKGTWRR